MNFLVIALDTQRRDHLSCYGYPRTTSPILDQLAAESVVFDNCVTNTAHTMPTFTTLITGQAPNTHGIVGTLYAHPNEPDQRLDDMTPVLAEQLRSAGYLTAAFDNLAEFGSFPGWFVRGYHWYVNTWAPKGSHPCHVTADDINERLVPWLNDHARRQPWFLLVHYWDPHQPYNQPEPYRTMHVGGPQLPHTDVGERGYIPRWGWADRLDDEAYEKIDLYDGELSYVDDRIGQLLRVLDDAGVYDDTCIIVTADHGEDMEEHNAPFEHREPYETTCGVPLIVKPPEGIDCSPGRRVGGIVGHIDLMPSLLDMAGIEAPGSMDGSSWVPMLSGDAHAIHDALFVTGGAYKVHGRWVCPETAVRTDRYKYIRRGTAEYHGQTALDITCLVAPWWRRKADTPLSERADFFNALPRRELYDLHADPNETVNLVDAQPDVAAEMDARLREFTGRKRERFVLE